MRIKEIGYKRLVNLGNYQNETYEARAALDDGEDPTETFAQLRGWVLERIAEAEAEGLTANETAW